MRQESRLMSTGWQLSLLSRMAGTAVLLIPTFNFFSAHAQTSAAGANWERVKALPQNTRLHVSADHKSSTCRLNSVSDAALMCGKRTFPREQVKTVNLTRYGTSFAAGAAIAGGVGAGLGVAAVSDGGVLEQSNKAKAAGVGAILGAIIGALVSGPADLFRGPTIYRRP